eukprot:TRINITY_DN1821_c0_g2_i3.p2 TRINITY_DN1821_c0_g2~~TRINITY_DN1821_c0_g2_i3.p2  ORF type:complete len:360 (-),score=101.34 TRINITY_DN1821_c0_g2_i3:53-1132(-)
MEGREQQQQQQRQRQLPPTAPYFSSPYYHYHIDNACPHPQHPQQQPPPPPLQQPSLLYPFYPYQPFYSPSFSTPTTPTTTTTHYPTSYYSPTSQLPSPSPYYSATPFSSTVSTPSGATQNLQSRKERNKEKQQKKEQEIQTILKEEQLDLELYEKLTKELTLEQQEWILTKLLTEPLLRDLLPTATQTNWSTKESRPERRINECLMTQIAAAWDEERNQSAIRVSVKRFDGEIFSVMLPLGATFKDLRMMIQTHFDSRVLQERSKRLNWKYVWRRYGLKVDRSREEDEKEEDDATTIRQEFPSFSRVYHLSGRDGGDLQTRLRDVVSATTDSQQQQQRRTSTRCQLSFSFQRLQTSYSN